LFLDFVKALLYSGKLRSIRLSQVGEAVDGMKPPLRGVRFVVLLCIAVWALSGCGRAAETRLYRKAVTNKSILAAKDYFQRYPEGRHADELVEQLLAWCREEISLELPRMVLEILPSGHPGALELEQIIKDKSEAIEKSQ
jgi:hypothetical protein